MTESIDGLPLGSSSSSSTSSSSSSSIMSSASGSPISVSPITFKLGIAFSLTETDLLTLAPPSLAKSPALELAVGPVIDRVGGLSLNVGNDLPFGVFLVR